MARSKQSSKRGSRDETSYREMLGAVDASAHPIKTVFAPPPISGPDTEFGARLARPLVAKKKPALAKQKSVESNGSGSSAGGGVGNIKKLDSTWTTGSAKQPNTGDDRETGCSQNGEENVVKTFPMPRIRTAEEEYYAYMRKLQENGLQPGVVGASSGASMNATNTANPATSMMANSNYYNNYVAPHPQTHSATTTTTTSGTTTTTMSNYYVPPSTRIVSSSPTSNVETTTAGYNMSQEGDDTKDFSAQKSCATLNTEENDETDETSSDEEAFAFAPTELTFLPRDEIVPGEGQQHRVPPLGNKDMVNGNNNHAANNDAEANIDKKSYNSTQENPSITGIPARMMGGVDYAGMRMPSLAYDNASAGIPGLTHPTTAASAAALGSSGGGGFDNLVSAILGHNAAPRGDSTSANGSPGAKKTVESVESKPAVEDLNLLRPKAKNNGEWKPTLRLKKKT
ncbi:unnamed protein product [Amoebophrya sp. A25]|nr:unnamed protein product [Amoebophrya sp. A25]|eukprot:GSA25T00012538001.1